MPSNTRRALAFGLVPVIALSGTALLATSASAASTTQTAAKTGIVTTTEAAPGKQLRLTVAGDTLGKRAKIKVVGVSGGAKGYAKTVGVKANKTKSLKRLKTGKYKIKPKKITNGSVTATGSPSPRKVKVKAKRGASITVAYSSSASKSSNPSGSQTAGSANAPTNLRLDRVMIGGVEKYRAQWNAPTAKPIKTYTVFVKEDGPGQTWQDYTPSSFTDDHFEYAACSDLLLLPYRGKSGSAYIKAVYTDGTSSEPSNTIRATFTCD